ncbi:LIM domain-containing protein PLIM2b-like [Cucurbita maxima]|uniref:LIM domain-containing protein PLIM2b-like n=1 Tax=Cucurbita maxima TaxID=3661 RepID=A0A6J1ICJ4_CUCMA|nr:LIM domain-containing protein PLIM2b-like [Cucurbita maxima]XP_022975247.1 LIM domain-containing protein PLIM2b-like [Cucurbita maxima]XP_022975535.1 LIM domain-containing protein PLIM2b-like [Cucurbita maxima]
MAFTGTLDKCKACNKTVYVVDLLSLEGNPYHKNCFRCSHCKGTLSMTSHSWMDGVLYCKPHFDQLFKESGNFANFQSKSDKKPELTRTNSKLSAMFCGTQDRCAACSKVVYPLEKISLEGECYHKNCFRCAHGGCNLTHSSYAALDGVLYCKHHFAQLFMVKGNYTHVLQAAANKKATMTPAEHAEKDGKPQPDSEDGAVEQS